MLAVINEDGSTPSGSSLLDEIVRESARRMLADVLGAEVGVGVVGWGDERDDLEGRRECCGVRWEVP
ncbi:hypothetical protein [Streptomyces sp. NPDC055186]